MQCKLLSYYNNQVRFIYWIIVKTSHNIQYLLNAIQNLALLLLVVERVGILYIFEENKSHMDHHQIVNGIIMHDFRKIG